MNTEEKTDAPQVKGYASKVQVHLEYENRTKIVGTFFLSLSIFAFIFYFFANDATYNIIGVGIDELDGVPSMIAQALPWGLFILAIIFFSFSIYHRCMSSAVD